MAGSLNGARKLNSTPQLKLRSVPAISPHTIRRDRLETIALKGLELFGTHKILAPKFDKLTAILDKDSLPARFFDHSKLPKHIDNLEKILEHKVQGIQINNRRINKLAKKAQGPLQGILDIYDNASPAASQPLSFEQRIQNKLGGKFTEDWLQDAIHALKILSEENTNGLFKKYLNRLLANHITNFDIVGAITELRAILYIGQNTNIEIVNANATLSQKGSLNQIEFFDIIGRDRDSGRLIIFEIKGDNGYGFGDFIFQFLGLGSQYKGKNRKTLSQKDVLLNPENFDLPSLYQKDIKEGNYEIRIVTHKRLFDFENIYGHQMTIRQLLRRLLLSSTPISASGKILKDLTRTEINREIISLENRMAEAGHCLENIPIRFELMTWYQNQRAH
ncbi:MAG: hypothetical protein V3T21_02445 [Candidatus Margulisiibacteriota bacterium]